MQPRRQLLLFLAAILMCGLAARAQSAPARWGYRQARGTLPGCVEAGPSAYQDASAGPSGIEKASPTRGPEMVKLAFTARDKKGRLVLDLTQEEVRIFEDGIEQKIEYFSPELTLPLNLGLLLDLSRSQRRRMTAAAHNATEPFFRRALRKGDQAFVMGFRNQSYLVGDFMGDPENLLQAVRQTAEIGASGGTRLYDTIEEACRVKLAGRPGRKVLVIITDGEDNSSTKTREEALEAATRAGTVIYIVRTSEVSSAGTLTRGAGVCRQLSERTGGRDFAIVMEKDFGEAFVEIAEDLANQYTVGYFSTSSPRPGTFREIKVQCTRKGLRFYGPKGYQIAKD